MENMTAEKLTLIAMRLLSAGEHLGAIHPSGNFYLKSATEIALAVGDRDHETIGKLAEQAHASARETEASNPRDTARIDAYAILGSDLSQLARLLRE